MIYEYSSFFENGKNKVVLGFKCTYDENFRLCFAKNNIQFDSHDLKIKIDDIANNYDKEKSKDYENKYGNVSVLSVSMYLFDNINEIEYVKFIYKEHFDILYKDEVLSMLLKNNKFEKKEIYGNN